MKLFKSYLGGSSFLKSSLKISSVTLPLFVAFTFISCSKGNNPYNTQPLAPSQKSIGNGTDADPIDDDDDDLNGGIPSPGKPTMPGAGTSGGTAITATTMVGDDCVLYSPDPEFVDPTSHPAGMTPASQVKWAAVTAKTTPRLPARRYFYRWGNLHHEAPRIGRNSFFTIYPVNNVNAAGGAAAGIMGGPGLYLSPTPLHSANYATLGAGIAYNRLYTISVAKNTPIFDNTLIPGISQNDVEWLDSTNANPNQFVLPIVHSYAWGNRFGITTLNRGQHQIIKNIALPRAWVLKTSIGARYEEEFTGRELSTQTLIDTITDSNMVGPGPAGRASVREYYLRQIQGTLGKRIYNPDPAYVETLPTPKTVTVERHNWGADPDLAVCGALPPTARHKYFWRYDGSCGEYTETGKTLLRDNVPIHNCYTEWHAQTYSYCKKHADNACYEYLQVNPQTFIITAHMPGMCTAASPFCDERAGVIP